MSQNGKEVTVLLGAAVGIGVLYALPYLKALWRPATATNTTSATTTSSTTTKKKKQVKLCLEKNEEYSPQKPAESGEHKSAASSSLPVLVEALRGGVGLENIKKLLQDPTHDPSKVFPSSSGRTILHECVEHLGAGQEPLIDLFVNDYHIDLFSQDKNNGNLTALHCVCVAGTEPIALHMISIYQQHEQISHTNSTPSHAARWTALHFACARGRHGIVKALIDAHAELNAQNDMGSTPLHLALMAKSWRCAILLVDAGASVTLPDNMGQVALHVSTVGGYEMHAAVEAIIQKVPSSINTQDAKGFTPLHLALQRGHGRLSALLFANKADLSIGDVQYKVTPLHLVSSANENGLLQTFLKGPEGEANADETKSKTKENEHKKLNLEVKDSVGRTPLMVAVMRGAKATSLTLMEHGANVNCVDEGKCNVLGWGLNHGHKEIVWQLLKQPNIKLHHVDQYGNSSLQLACFKGKEFTSIAEQILEKLPEHVNLADKNGRCPLHWAAAHGDARLCTSLLDAGANYNMKTQPDDILPIHWAAHNAENDTLEMLLEEAKIKGNMSSSDSANLVDGKGRSALHWLCKRIGTQCSSNGGEEENVKEDFTEQGTIPDAQLERVLTFLIKNGASLELKDKSGCRPLDLLQASKDWVEKAESVSTSGTVGFGFGEPPDGEEVGGEEFVAFGE